MTRADAKRILRAYRAYARKADARHGAEKVDFDLAVAAFHAQRSLSDLVIPALNRLGINSKGAIEELIDEALAA